MAAIAEIKKSLTKETYLIEKSAECEEIIIDDESLDHALDCTNSINKINDSYIRVLAAMDNLSKLQIEEKSDEEDVREILSALKMTNRSCIALWISFNNDDFLRIACKSALLDLRINVRMMKEYIEDIHNKFFLKDQDKSEMNQLFDSL